jgi:hypothetical protein
VNVTGDTVTVGANGIQLPSLATAIAVFGSVSLPVGTVIASIAVRMTDSVGTTVTADFGDEAGVILSSAPSAGTGLPQTLIITGPFTLLAGTSYWIDGFRATGTGSWSLQGATIV